MSAPLLRPVVSRFVVLAAAALIGARPAAAQHGPAAPIAALVPRVDTLHGEVRVDNYFWLRDRDNPETIKYLEAENAYTTAGMKPTEGLQQRLYDEILARIKQTDLSVPELEHGYYYYTRTIQGKDYGIMCRRKGSPTAPEEVILDINALAAGKKYYGLGGTEVSPDGRYLLFLEDTTARRYYTLRIKDLTTGKMLDDVIPDVTNGTAWANDNRTFFYTLPDSARRDYAVKRHTLGEPLTSDALIRQEDDLLFSMNLGRTKSGRFIQLDSYSYTSGETRLIDADHPRATAVLVEPRRDGVEYDVDDLGDRLLIRTNEGAVNFRLMEAPAAQPGRANWKPWLPYVDSIFTERMDVFRHAVVISERRGGLRTLRIVDLKTKQSRFVKFPEAAYGVFPFGNRDWDAPALRYAYSSFVTPNSVFDYDLATGTSKQLKRDEVLGGYDPSKYAVERFDVRARDGAMVPVSILYKKPLVKNGMRPLLLYAYGSYGATQEPTFASARFSLVDRGVIYVLAHIRGGQEKGRPWYDAGKMMHKKNTFNDYVDVAQFLVDKKWTASERLVANGGSAGGLLMGVVTNMRPDLFKAVVADVPFVDVINTMLDASIPLTAAEWKQWGNPHTKEEYVYMKTYSPYDNVEHKAYPWLLVTTSLNDSQVGFWEPAKWTAKLRATKTDANPLYLKTNMAGGHGGSSGRYDRYRETAFRYAFMLEAMGLAPAAVP